MNLTLAEPNTKHTSKHTPERTSKHARKHVSKRTLDVQAELAAFGFTRPFFVRLRPLAFIVCALGLAFFLGSSERVVAWLAEHKMATSGVQVSAVVISLGTLLFGCWQWGAARSEISLDKFYERLKAPNDKLDGWTAGRTPAR